MVRAGELLRQRVPLRDALPVAPGEVARVDREALDGRHQRAALLDEPTHLAREVGRLVLVERVREREPRARHPVDEAERRLLARRELGERADARRREHERRELVDELAPTAGAASCTR